MGTLAKETLGRYRLAERIGTGGMAEIYLARYADGTDLDPFCVVKRMLPELTGDPEMVSLFLDEARLNLQLDHPNIAAVFDVGRDGDDLFLAMEYVNGRDLRWVLSAQQRAGTRIPPELALFVTGELLKALGHAHAARDERGRPLGLVHRDISPENLLLGRNGQVKLTDFGAARSSVSRSRHGRETLMGKIGYLAPECLDRGHVTASSDRFAAGLVLFEMLTGGALLGADTAQRAWTFWSGFDPTAVIPARVPLAEGGAILVKALETDPRRRYRDADGFLQDVQDQLFRRGRGVGGRELGTYLAGLEGSGEERGRVTTAPVELPALDFGHGRAVEGESAEEETVEGGAHVGEPTYLFASGRALGPLGETTARLRLEEAGWDGSLVCRGRRYWVPAHTYWGEPAPAGEGARRLRCVSLGTELLRQAAAGGGRRITWWLQQQLVSVVLESGVIVRAVHFAPAAGPPMDLPLGEDGADPGPGGTAALLDRGQRRTMRRRELRRFLMLPLRWDEFWTSTVVVASTAQDAGGGVEVLPALADAARAVPGDARIADLVGAAAAGGLVAHPRGRPLGRAAGLWRSEREVLDRIARGEHLTQLLRRYQVDAQGVFRSLFVLLQTGLVSGAHSGGGS